MFDLREEHVALDTGLSETMPYIHLEVTSFFHSPNMSYIHTPKPIYSFFTHLLIFYNQIQSIPLSLRAMFDQYFQLAHRLRKHYLSPRVIFCLITGQFVPPIHRRNLYSLQYSMLPARRAGMAEVWALLTQPKKSHGLSSGSSGSIGMVGGIGIGTTGNGLLKVPPGFGQGDARRRGYR